MKIRTTMVLTAALAATTPAHAGPVTYTWTPMAGSGYSYYGDQMTGFSFWDGTLSITWDPDNPYNNDVGASTGVPTVGSGATGYAVWAELSGDSLALGGNISYSWINVQLWGTPGPLNAQGLPLTLDGYLNQDATVTGRIDYIAEGRGAYYQGFAGPGAPEPPGWLLMALGAGGVMAGGYLGRTLGRRIKS
jgi:hypothetical protein